MTRVSRWRGRVGAVVAVGVAAAMMLAACGRGTETTAGGTPPGSTSATVSPLETASPSASAPEDDAVPAGWTRVTVGQVSVGLPKGWGHVTLENGKLNTHGMDLWQEAAKPLQERMTTIVSAGGSMFVLIDKSTMTVSLRESWITQLELLTADADPLMKAETTEDLQALLSELDPGGTVGPFVHPVMPAAVSKGVDQKAGEVLHDYAIGYSPVIIAFLSTDERNPEPDINTAEAIVRTIRLVKS